MSSSQKLVALAVAVPFMLMMVLDLGLLKKIPPAHSPSPSGPSLAVNAGHNEASPQSAPDAVSTSSGVNVPTPQSGSSSRSVANPTNQSDPQPTAVTVAKTPTDVAGTINTPTSVANPPANTPSSGHSDTNGVLDAVQAVVQTSSQILVGTVKDLTSVTASLL